MELSGSAISPASVVEAGPEQVSTDLGEEILVLHLVTGGYFSLRNVAARVWRLIEKPVRVSEISRAVAEEYGVAPERCERDLLELLENLARRGLVTVRERGEA